MLLRQFSQKASFVSLAAALASGRTPILQSTGLPTTTASVLRAELCLVRETERISSDRTADFLDDDGR
ncbi:hypothetical protein [Streptomyces sp. NBC_01367]|uniref:hypothetical protein n=1 Tax=Streptomyces sp. NBC_01367 TaxID=2903841 RepID=UPI0032568A35